LIPPCLFEGAQKKITQKEHCCCPNYF